MVPKPSYPTHPMLAGASRQGFAMHARDAAALTAQNNGLLNSLPSKDAGPETADPLPSEWWVLRRFIAETCHTAPGSLNSYVDLEESMDFRPGQGAVLGFRAHLYEWCRSRHRGLPLPTLQGSEWANALPDGVRFLDPLRVRLVFGLDWRPRDKEPPAPPISGGWLVVESADVLLHVACLVILPMLLTYYALDAQRSWGRMLCLPDGLDAVLPPAASASITADGAATPRGVLTSGGVGRCAMAADFAPLQYKLTLIGGNSPLPLVAIMVTWEMLLLIVCVLRLAYLYLNLEHTLSVSFATSFFMTILHGAFMTIHLAVIFGGAGMILSWSILGAASRPTATLPLYALVVAVVLVIKLVGGRMFSARRLLKEALRTRFLHMLHPHVQRAYTRTQLQLALQRSAAVGKHLARPANWQDIDLSEVAHAEMLENQMLFATERPPTSQSIGSAKYPYSAEVEAARAAMISGAMPGHEPYGTEGRMLQPMDVYLLLAGDGTKPLRVEHFRPRFEALELPLTTEQKEVLFSQVEMEREMELEAMHRQRMYHTWRQDQQRAAGVKSEEEGAPKVGSGDLLTRIFNPGYAALAKSVPKRDFHEEHPYVTARQFCDGWEAMEQGLMRRAVLKGGVAATQIFVTVGLCLGALALLLTFLTVGTRRAAGLMSGGGDGDGAAFVAVVRFVLTISCALFVVTFRPRTRAEAEYHRLSALVEEIVSEDLARAAEV